MRTPAQQIFILGFSVSSMTWAPCWVRTDPTQELSPAGEADGAHAAGCVGAGSSGGHPASGRTAPWVMTPPWGPAGAIGAGAGEEGEQDEGNPHRCKGPGLWRSQKL